MIPKTRPLSTQDTFFSAPPVHQFETPVPASIEIEAGYTPMVRYSGSLWRFKYDGLYSRCWTNKQIVQIIGRQGNTLLIKVQGDADE
jgi:hypothetical protein